jgi:hypothetical protein
MLAMGPTSRDLQRLGQLTGSIAALLVGLICPLQRVVAQQLLYQVHVRHDHSPAAVPGQLQGIKCLSATPREQQNTKAGVRPAMHHRAHLHALQTLRTLPASR